VTWPRPCPSLHARPRLMPSCSWSMPRIISLCRYGANWNGNLSWTAVWSFRVGSRVSGGDTTGETVYIHCCESVRCHRGQGAV
jgi:hypothetical protein